MKTHRPHQRAACLLTACGVAVSSALPAAGAEESPYSAGASVALTHDDNLFRSPAAQAIADRRITTSLFGEMDQRSGRHRLLGQASINDNRYRTREELDNLGYRGRLAWTGATAGDISWALSHEASRQLASYGTVADPGFRDANAQSVQQTLASVQLGMWAQWVANATLAHRRVDHTAAAFERERVQLSSVGFGLQWNPVGAVSVSAGPRFTRGRVPLASDGIDRSFERRDIDFGLRWVASGASTLNARLSATRQRSEAQGLADFSGATGQLDWQWAASGRTRLNVALSR